MSGWVTRQWWSAGVVLACVAGVGAAPPAPLRATAFGKVDIEPSKVSGVLWIERDIVEAKQPIDTDGDVNYSPGELMAARGPVTDYINKAFFLLWDGKIHPVVARDLVTEKRPGLKYDYLKVTWVAETGPNAAPVTIVSRLLCDAWREARTMLCVTTPKHKEVWILSPTDYFDIAYMGKPVESRVTAPRSKPMGRRFACMNLCLGVQLKEGATKCPKCGNFIAELRGENVPGAGYFGLHGGQLMSTGPGERRLEAILASKEELRVYVTNEGLARLPVGKASGTVELWTEEMMETTLVKATLAAAASGEYLVAKVPANMILPMRARCVLDLGDGANYMVDFFLPEVLEVKD